MKNLDFILLIYVSSVMKLSMTTKTIKDLAETQFNHTVLDTDNMSNITNHNPLIYWTQSGDPHLIARPLSSIFWGYLIYSVVFLLFAGIFSGLTIGYLSLDQKYLNHVLTNGTPEEKNYATRISPLMNKRHWLLSTLVIANAFCVQAFPICLDAIIPAYITVFISTIFIIILGEVLPQNYCTGSSQLKIAAFMTPFVKILMKILFFASKPLASFMDTLLRAERHDRFIKPDLVSMYEISKNTRVTSSVIREDSQTGSGLKNSNTKEVDLNKETIKFLSAILDLKDTLSLKKMIPLSKVFMLSDQTIITADIVKKIYSSSYSKIPVYHEKSKKDINILGFIKAKSLLTFSENFMNKTIAQSGILLEEILILAKDVTLLELFMLFQDNHTKIAFLHDETIKDKKGQLFFTKKDLVYDSKKKSNSMNLIGMVTMKNIMEVILERQLVDRTFKDNINIYRTDILRNHVDDEEIGKTPISGLRKEQYEDDMVMMTATSVTAYYNNSQNNNNTNTLSKPLLDKRVKI